MELKRAEIIPSYSMDPLSHILRVENVHLPNEKRHSGGVMTTITVSDSAQLSAALKGVKDGDTILLRGGEYSSILIRDLKIDGNVTIKSLDVSDPATLLRLQIQNSKGLTFSDLDVSVTKAAPLSGAVGVFNSENIHFDRLDVHGSMNGNPQDDSDGFRIKESDNVSVTNSEFQQLRIGIGHGDSNNIYLAGNNIHDLSLDGIRGGGSSNVTIKNNVFKDFYQATGDHADAIQFYPGQVNKIVQNIVVEGNVVVQGAGQEIQGIFLRNVDDALFQNVTITKNLIVGGNWNAIMVEGSQNLRVVDNTVISMANEVSWVRILRAENATVSGNDALKFMFDKGSSIAASDNNINKAASDGGLAALKNWLSSHSEILNSLPKASLGSLSDIVSDIGTGSPPDVGSIIPPIGTPDASAGDPIFTGGNGVTVGTDGNDVLLGTAGDDVLQGGEGIDTVSYGSATGGVTVSLIRWNGDSVASVFQNTAGAGKDKLVDIENLTGSTFNDALTGDNAHNVLSGGAGDDTLSGGLGADTLHGGTGADMFRYSSVSESTVDAAGRDVIYDFNSSEGDKINLRQVDAVAGTLGNENFKLVANFTKVAGQVTSTAEGDHYVVQGDTNGDGAADFAISVFSSTNLTAGDFVL